MPLWDLTPDAAVLDDGTGGDVYTATAPASRRVLYFPNGGTVEPNGGTVEIDLPAWG